jgi:hypothetical protein
MRLDGSRLTYVLTNGAVSTVDLGEVDWNKTVQDNAETGSTLTLRSDAAR